ncbi:DNA polymerase IV [Bifidobacterium olomucense]|nr:DNA polymerase IV [Bifidobacterium sp. DSM 109959]
MSTAPRLEAAKRDWGHDESGCTVLHIDMDAFYASLEVARHPELRGLPVIIGTGTRSVVSAASYEARRYGINSAMPAARARQLCPDGIFLPVDMRYYRHVSQRIMHEVFLTITDRFEQVSVDEGYMDVSAALLAWKRPSAIGAWIRTQVAERFHITCSVGIACNKLIAKMASTNAKPNGMLLIPAARSAEFVQMMPLRGIPGIGPSLEQRLNAWGVMSVADLARMDESSLAQATGSKAAARGLWMASHGLDSRSIEPVREEKSIGSERTLDSDTRNMRVVCNLLRSACNEVAATLRRKGLVARTVTVRLRFADLSYQTRSFTMEQPTNTAGVLYPECVRQLRLMMGMPSSLKPLTPPRDADSLPPLPKLIRLAGMSVSSLSAAASTAVQPSLDDMLEADDTQGRTAQARRHDAEAALDAVRKRFGAGAAQFGA